MSLGALARCLVVEVEFDERFGEHRLDVVLVPWRRALAKVEVWHTIMVPFRRSVYHVL